MQAIESMDLKLTIVPKKKGKKTPVVSLKQSLMISHLINKHQLEDCKCFSCHPEKRRQIDEKPVSKLSQVVFDCISRNQPWEEGIFYIIPPKEPVKETKQGKLPYSTIYNVNGSLK